MPIGMKYPKINSLFKRDMEAPGKPIMLGEWSNGIFESLVRAKWRFTEKINGANIRVQIHPESTIELGGRSENSNIPAALVNELSALFSTVDLQATPYADSERGVLLLGEGCGPKIQKNGHRYGDKPGFILFGARAYGRWSTREELEEVADVFGLRIAPVILENTTIVEALGAIFQGVKSVCASDGELAEGIVGIPAEGLLDKHGHPILCKIKHSDFKNFSTEELRLFYDKLRKEE